MARKVSYRDIERTLQAARQWIDRCLIEDGSMFAPDSSLWTPDNVAEVKRAFVDHPDSGEGDFVRKLRGQMSGASAPAQRLMAEMLWALLLFPSTSKISTDTKRAQIREMLHLAGEQLDETLPVLSDDVLKGIGSGGPGFNNHRWRELVYLIAVVQMLKAADVAERRRIFAAYEAFCEWIVSVPQEGRRQFRHMLRYFAFPDVVERISSDKERRRILEGFGVKSLRETKRLTDQQLDEALLKLRRDLEAERPDEVIDYYDASMKLRWQEDDDAEEEQTQVPEESRVTESTTPTPRAGDGTSARNVILYGPPGTGKTHALQARFEAYTEMPDALDRDAWASELISRNPWRAVLAASLAEIGRPVRVPELLIHPWLEKKAAQKGRAFRGTRLWGLLQLHTPETVETVRAKERRSPGIFTKNERGEWSLLQDWRDLDDESAELFRLLKSGPAGAREPIRRYEVVTFHPSYSYEDFVRGIRPVAVDEAGNTQFRVVDGIFKRLCDEARANPAKRYALFIDEINRANVAKVFGELIALIETDKRTVYDVNGAVVSGLTVLLAGGGGDVPDEPFGIPANLDLYATMNTADRSIALLDVALRRRFEFQEMNPDYTQLERSVDSVRLDKLLRRINDRLEYLLDRDHRIGHAYLMKARSLDDLRRAFSKQIVPLLQEYFFDDLSRVTMVLATAAEEQFFEREPMAFNDLFPFLRAERGQTDRFRFVPLPEEQWSAETFRGVYEAGVAGAEPDSD